MHKVFTVVEPFGSWWLIPIEDDFALVTPSKTTMFAALWTKQMACHVDLWVGCLFATLVKKLGLPQQLVSCHCRLFLISEQLAPRRLVSIMFLSSFKSQSIGSWALLEPFSHLSQLMWHWEISIVLQGLHQMLQSNSHHAPLFQQCSSLQSFFHEWTHFWLGLDWCRSL